MSMNSSYQALLIMAVFAFAAAALAIHNHNREQAKRLYQKAKKEWGCDSPLSFSKEAYDSIRCFSDSEEYTEDKGDIDDITWKDCDLDRVYLRINHSMSSPGDDVLYSWLRHPLLNREKLTKRNELISYFEEHEEERLGIMDVLYKIGRNPKKSYFAMGQKLSRGPRIGRTIPMLLGVVTIVLILLLFIQPVVAIVLMIPDFILNVSYQLSKSRNIREYTGAFSGINRMIEGAEQLQKQKTEGLSEILQELSEITAKLKPLKKGSRFAVSKGTVGGGLLDVILEYLNLFFHLDLIQFDSLMEAYQGHEKEVRRLTELLGSIDAALSAASFRASLPYWCHHTEEKQEMTRSVEAEELYHVLLLKPVENSITTENGNLITGANASGKSTFLKSLTIAMILGQSIDTIPAKRFQAPFYRIYTSMALQDNLLEGESYFIVEIRSLKRIMDAAKEKGSPVFAVVDEVLRGTNTIERIAASAQLLTEIAKENTLLFAATHDIELTSILKEQFRNYHFNGTIKENDVIFDYRIKEGPTRERNAIALLKTAGYDEKLADRAEQNARFFEETGEWRL